MIQVDGEDYNRQDTLGTLAALALWWEQLALGRALPPGFHALMADQVRQLAAALDEPAPEPSLAVLGPLGDRVTAAVRGHDLEADEVLAVSLRLLRRAGDELRRAGALPATVTGQVAQINSSAGGVPKVAVAAARIEQGGLVGDRQSTRRHHGRPWQALCLWSVEVVDALAAEGHPIAYGSAGENLTLQGIPWDQVRAGVRLRLGTALAECTPFTLPCAQNRAWFLGGDFLRMHHDRGPWSRIYARVLEPGDVAPGDPAVLEP